MNTKKKKSTWLNDIRDCVTHPLSVTFIKYQTRAESSAKHNMVSIGSYRDFYFSLNFYG